MPLFLDKFSETDYSVKEAFRRIVMQVETLHGLCGKRKKDAEQMGMMRSEINAGTENGKGKIERRIKRKIEKRTADRKSAERSRMPERFKKGITITALLGIAVFAAACGKKEEEQGLLTISVYDPDAQYRGLQTGWYAKILEEKLSIQLKYLDTTAKGALEQADLLVLRKEEEDPEKLVTKGLFLNMAPYLEGTDLLNYEKALRYWNEPCWEQDIYIIPTALSSLSAETPSEERNVRYGLWVDWEAYEEAGTPELEDLEDLFAAAKAMQLQDGRRSAFSLHAEQRGTQQNAQSGTQRTGQDKDILDDIMAIAGAFGYETNGLVRFTKNSGSFDALLEEDGVTEQILSGLRQAWAEGLVQEEGESPLFTFYAEEKKGNYRLAPFEEMRPVSYGINPMGTVDKYLAVGSSTKDPQRMVQLLNWLYSTEGIMDGGTINGSKTAGPLGLTWQMEDGNPVLTEYGESVLLDSVKSQNVPAEWGNGTFREGSSRLSAHPVTLTEVCPSGFSYNYTLWNKKKTQVISGDEAIEKLSVEDRWSLFMEAEDEIEYLAAEGMLSVIPAYTEPSCEEPEEIYRKRNAVLTTAASYFAEMIRTEDEAEYEELWQKLRKRADTLGYREVLSYDSEQAEQLREERRQIVWKTLR